MTDMNKELLSKAIIFLSTWDRSALAKSWYSTPFAPAVEELRSAAYAQAKELDFHWPNTVKKPPFIVSAEWERKEDRRLDGLDDAQLRYLHAAIKITLDERGWLLDTRSQKWSR